ncbi:MAG: flagellar motor switch protein FliM [Verrucomicrobiota bacterium]
MNPPTPPSAPAESPATEAGQVSVLTQSGAREHYKPADIRKHDFRQSGFLAPSELRRIKQRHEQFVRGVAARLAIFLRLEFTLQLSKVQILTYQKFTESLTSPTQITLFKTEPLKGVGLLVMTPAIGLAFVDRLLGGPGKSPESTRDLSDIEVALIDQVSTIILTEWCNHWPEMRELHPALLGHENNSKYLQTATPDTAMLTLSLEGGFGEKLEPIQIAFPFGTVEPLMRLLSPSLQDSDSAPIPVGKPRWSPGFDDIKVPVVAEWQGLKMSAGDITKLKVGDVITLDPASAAQVQLRLSHMAKFTGRPGTCGGKWAVQLTSAIGA